jgi:hypothetical protein
VIVKLFIGIYASKLTTKKQVFLDLAAMEKAFVDIGHPEVW